jgi:hypothetical protein
MGGEGCTVQIDEMLMRARRKNNTGRLTIGDLEEAAEKSRKRKHGGDDDDDISAALLLSDEPLEDDEEDADWVNKLGNKLTNKLKK